MLGGCPRRTTTAARWCSTTARQQAGCGFVAVASANGAKNAASISNSNVMAVDRRMCELGDYTEMRTADSGLIRLQHLRDCASHMDLSGVEKRDVPEGAIPQKQRQLGPAENHALDTFPLV